MEGVAVACGELLKSVEKTKENAMKILLKAQVCHADEARQQCYDILQQLTVNELEKNEFFEELGQMLVIFCCRKQGILKNVWNKYSLMFLGFWGGYYACHAN